MLVQSPVGIAVCRRLPFVISFTGRPARTARFPVDDAGFLTAFLDHQIELTNQWAFDSGDRNGERFDGCIGKASEMLSVALENWQDDYAVKIVAEPFSVTISGVERPLIGEFDLVVEEGGGQEPCIVDWKTSSSRWPAGKADYERQATAYCYAYRALHQHNPLFRYDVFTKAKQPQVGNWYTVRTDDELSRFEELCRQVEHCVNAGVFYRNESQMNCGDCPYRDRCRKGGVR